MAGHESLSINPALEDLAVLVGSWEMELSNARFLPDPTATARGSASFEWIEGGGFLVMRQGSRASGAPYSTSIIGRDAPGFFQRFTGSISKDGKTIGASWEMSEDGAHWQHDFDLTYRRK